MAEIPLRVIDATVVGKWYLRDEEFAEQALRVFEDYDQQRIQLIAPSHLWYEVPSIISKAVGGGRISEYQGHQAISLFFGLNLRLFHSQSLIAAGFQYSVGLQCPLYDATYLALADAAECPFIYADRRLHRTLRGRFSRAVWIEDYRLV